MQPRTVHIYWAEYERHHPPISQAGLHLSASVQRRWQQYRTTQQQTMSLLAKRLLLYGLKQLKWRPTGDLADFSHRPNGKPYLAQLPIHFSLSHSKQIAVCAISADEPIGIDVQEQLKTPPESERLFLNAAEQQPTTEDNRLELWCCKEAAYKAMGHELGARFSDFYVAAPLRVDCPPVSLELIPQRIQTGYVCYLAVPAHDAHLTAPACITTERVPYPY